MAEEKQGLIQDGWFHERNKQWPGKALSIQMKEGTLHIEQSKYQQVICFESTHHGNVLVLDGAIQCCSSDEFSYQEMITNLGMMSHPNPRNILVIGGGDGGVLREVVKHDCVEKADLCDIDEAVPRLSKKYLPHMAQGLEHRKVTVVIGDGLEFVKKEESKNHYDLIITDSSDPEGPARKLFEKEYFEDCYKALREGGVITTQGESFWENLNFIAGVKKACKEVFPVVEWAWSSTPTYPSGIIGYIVATKDPLRNVRRPVRSFSREEERKYFKYYNQDIHSASFVLPTEAREVIEAA